jgi:hypothetical protein
LHASRSAWCCSSEQAQLLFACDSEIASAVPEVSRSVNSSSYTELTFRMIQAHGKSNAALRSDDISEI